MKVRIALIISIIAVAAIPALSQSSGSVTVGKGHPFVKEKPEPDWPTDIKKKSEVVIVLRAVFSSDSTVTNIRFVETRSNEPPDYSLDEIKELVERAEEAAAKIKFKPATKDGKNVSMWMQLEYSFQLDEKKTPPREPKKPQ
jgi:hypothetical protein